MRGNCLIKHVTEGKIEGRIEVMGRRGRRCKQLLDDLKERRGYWKLKEEALGGTLWRTCFGRGSGPVIKQTIDMIHCLPSYSPTSALFTVSFSQSLVAFVLRIHASSCSAFFMDILT
jgi:hypothetical protein